MFFALSVFDLFEVDSLFFLDDGGADDLFGVTFSTLSFDFFAGVFPERSLHLLDEVDRSREFFRDFGLDFIRFWCCFASGLITFL